MIRSSSKITAKLAIQDNFQCNQPQAESPAQTDGADDPSLHI